VNQTNLRFPEWQGPLQDLILEFDREKLRGKMQEVEAVIHERLRQVDPSHDVRGEREALSDGLSILRVIRRDRLGSAD
jgi:hypothetical protein